MIAPIAPGTVSALGAPSSGKGKPEQLKEAAQQFEAIFLRQVLAAARSTDFGGDDLFGESDDTFREMRDAQFAQIASQTGALGFAARIEAQLVNQMKAQE